MDEEKKLVREMNYGEKDFRVDYHGNPSISLKYGEYAIAHFCGKLRECLDVRVEKKGDSKYEVCISSSDELGGCFGTLEVILEGKSFEKVSVNKNNGEKIVKV